MAENTYEGLFILDANKFARDRENLAHEVEEIITTLGGTVKVSRLWEERRLAYAIKGHRKGAYWLIYFTLDTQSLTQLNRQCDLHEGVLRQMVLKIHPRLVEPILSHASEVHHPAAEPAPTQDEGEASAAQAEPAATE